MNEQQIIQGLRKKDSTALHHAIYEYTPTIKKVAHSVMNLPEEKGLIDEVVNDVLLVLWYNIHQYDEEKAPFLHWIISVSKYKAIDYKRKRSKQQDFQLKEEIIATEEHPNDESERFYTIISSLSQSDKELFIKRYLNEDSIEAIAQDLGISIDSIYKRLSRGRQKLKQTLEHLT